MADPGHRVGEHEIREVRGHLARQVRLHRLRVVVQVVEERGGHCRGDQERYPGLAGDPAALHLDAGDEAPDGVGDPQRLGDDRLQVAAPEVLARRLAVDHQDAVAGDQPDAGNRVLAPPGAVVIVLTTLWHG